MNAIALRRALRRDGKVARHIRIAMNGRAAERELKSIAKRSHRRFRALMRANGRRSLGTAARYGMRLQALRRAGSGSAAAWRLACVSDV